MRIVMKKMEGPDSVFADDVGDKTHGSPSLNIHSRRKRERLVQRMRQISSSTLVTSEDTERARLKSKDESIESSDSGVVTRRYLSSASTDSTDSGIGRIQRDPLEDRIRGRQESCSKNKKFEYRILMLGPSRSGKTAIISQFLYDTFVIEHNETVDEMYRGEFDTETCSIALNIEDTGGNYFQEFRTMADISFTAADAFVLVYSMAEPETFLEVAELKEKIHEMRGADMPVVVAGNKCDLGPQLQREEFQATVMLDWNHGFVECSARNNKNVSAIFKELLRQAEKLDKLPEYFKSLSVHKYSNLKRRSSMPQVPKYIRGDSMEKLAPRRKKQLSEDLRRNDSCTIS